MNVKNKFTDSMKTVKLVAPSIYVDHRHRSEDYQLHKHSFFEVEFFLSGYADNTVDGKKYAIVPGSIFIYNTSNFHEINNISEKLDYFYLGFDETLTAICADASRLIEILPIVAEIATDSFEFSHLKALFKGLHREYFADFPDKNAYLMHIVELIMLTFLRVADRNLPPRTVDIADMALAYIRRNFKSRITLNEIAEHVHCSPSYLSSLFHAAHQKSVVEYINDMRLTYARNVLSVTPQISITELCYSVGYKSYSYFSKKFKEKFGISPKDAAKK